MGSLALWDVGAWSNTLPFTRDTPAGPAGRVDSASARLLASALSQLSVATDFVPYGIIAFLYSML